MTSHFPEVVTFEGIGDCFYRHEGFRAVKAGEYYLSGAVVSAWLAVNDLPGGLAYNVVVPTYHALPARAYQRGRKIERK